MLKGYIRDYLGGFAEHPGYKELAENDDFLEVVAMCSSLDDGVVRIDIQRLERIGVASARVDFLPAEIEIEDVTHRLGAAAAFEAEKVRREFDAVISDLIEKLARARSRGEIASVLSNIVDRDISAQVERALLSSKVLDMEDIYTDKRTGFLNANFYESFIAPDALRMRRKEDMEAYNIFLSSIHGRGQVMFCDLANLKAINDLVGYSVGDETIAVFSDYIHENFPDVVPIRYGGDEFVLFATDEDADAIAKALASDQALQHSLMRPSGGKVQTFIGCGAARFILDDTPAISPEGILSCRDAITTAIKTSAERMKENKKSTKAARGIKDYRPQEFDIGGDGVAAGRRATSQPGTK